MNKDQERKTKIEKGAEDFANRFVDVMKDLADKDQEIKENKCTCYKVQERPREKVMIHLLGCEEDKESKAYFQLKWWQRLFKRNPVRCFKYW